MKNVKIAALAALLITIDPTPALAEPDYKHVGVSAACTAALAQGLQPALRINPFASGLFSAVVCNMAGVFIEAGQRDNDAEFKRSLASNALGSVLGLGLTLTLD